MKNVYVAEFLIGPVNDRRLELYLPYMCMNMWGEESLMCIAVHVIYPSKLDRISVVKVVRIGHMDGQSSVISRGEAQLNMDGVFLV